MTYNREILNDAYDAYFEGKITINEFFLYREEYGPKFDEIGELMQKEYAWHRRFLRDHRPRWLMRLFD